MTNTSAIVPIPVGLDDGYAFTKLALPDGRLIVIPSRARVGRSDMTWIHGAEQRVFEYETEGGVYCAGPASIGPWYSMPCNKRDSQARPCMRFPACR